MVARTSAECLATFPSTSVKTCTMAPKIDAAVAFDAGKNSVNNLGPAHLVTFRAGDHAGCCKNSWPIANNPRNH